MEQGRIFCVFSPEGRRGPHVVATNLAVALKQTTNKKVALVDGSLFFGDVGRDAERDQQKTIIELVTRIDELDEELLRDVMVTHSSGIHVLLAPLQPQDGRIGAGRPISRGSCRRLRRSFDYIIVEPGRRSPSRCWR